MMMERIQKRYQCRARANLRLHHLNTTTGKPDHEEKGKKTNNQTGLTKKEEDPNGHPAECHEDQSQLPRTTIAPLKTQANSSRNIYLHLDKKED